MKKTKTLLLLAGYAGPLTYLIHDVLGGMTATGNYSFIVDTISDLTNSKARGGYPLGVLLLIISALMAVLFGLGILLNLPAARSKELFYAGLIFIATGSLQLLTATVFPQDPMSAPLMFPGLMHLVIVGCSAILVIVMLSLVMRWEFSQSGSSLFGGFTLLTLVLMIGGGIGTAIVVKGQVPIIGLVERLSIYPFQLWTMALAYRLTVKSNILSQSEPRWIMK